MCFSVSLFIHCFMYYFVVYTSVYSCLVCFPALVIVFTRSLYSEKILPDSISCHVSSFVLLFPFMFSVACFVSLLVWSICLTLLFVPVYLIKYKLVPGFNHHHLPG